MYKTMTVRWFGKYIFFVKSIIKQVHTFITLNTYIVIPSY